MMLDNSVCDNLIWGICELLLKCFQGMGIKFNLIVVLNVGGEIR